MDGQGVRKSPRIAKKTRTSLQNRGVRRVQSDIHGSTSENRRPPVPNQRLGPEAGPSPTKTIATKRGRENEYSPDESNKKSKKVTERGKAKKAMKKTKEGSSIGEASNATHEIENKQGDFQPTNQGCIMKAEWMQQFKTEIIRPTDAFFCGPITTLVLLYVDNIKWDIPRVIRQRPVIKLWSFERLRLRLESELEHGGLGLGDHAGPFVEVEINEERNPPPSPSNKYRGVFERL
ncbi:hypothetical protein L6452_09295 [Arctium lappa]|uniref:Uncharacterized protein n=1 Tax=Arctium lappa TaxID=4217 RepID=A0ACB9DKG4_ARCLA|nr:hypothetical protein L6452_09295 [Arctium lappa]